MEWCHQEMHTKLQVMKSQGNTQLGGLKCTWWENIKMEHREIWCRSDLDPNVGLCKHGAKLSGSIKAQNFLISWMSINFSRPCTLKLVSQSVSYKIWKLTFSLQYKKLIHSNNVTVVLGVVQVSISLQSYESRHFKHFNGFIQKMIGFTHRILTCSKFHYITQKFHQRSYMQRPWSVLLFHLINSLI